MHIVEQWLAIITKGDALYIEKGSGAIERDKSRPYIFVVVYHRYARLLFRKRKRKNGAPTRAVKTPTGRVVGAMTVRASRSARMRKIAPASAEAGSRRRWRGPSSRR